MPDGNPHKPDKRLAAVCGLFCPSCRIFLATHEDPKSLKQIAEYFNIRYQDARCEGCRTEERFPYCETCKMARCAIEKGIDFCGECQEYPCEDLKKFQSALPHRIELWKNQQRIREIGYEKWFAEMIAHYSCPKCKALNSAYDLTCRKCGNDPSCVYVRLHREQIISHLPKR